MNKLFNIHYTNISNDGPGVTQVYCSSAEDALSFKPELNNENIIINEIVELDQSRYANEQWDEALARVIKNQND